MKVGPSSDAHEPPRKRQRTVEHELPDAIRSSSSYSAHAVPDEPSAASGPSSSSALSPTSMRCTGPSGSVSHVASAEVAPPPETRQTAVLPDAHGSDDQSGSATGMKGSFTSVHKGKAKASTPTPMSTIPPGTQQNDPSVGAYGDKRDRDQTQRGADTLRHSASGATTKEPLTMGDEGRSGLALAPQAETEPVQDSVYYIHGGDCVIRVEDTLFRVHRYILGRDESAFQYMLSMPAVSGVPWQAVEGYCDDNPIHLYGETAGRFRDLLAVFYALPHELQEYNTPAGDVDRLLTICEMTNKYHFARTESWAVDALYNVVSGLHGPPQQQQHHLSHCSSAWMKRLLELALLCGHEQLRTLVTTRWVARILARDLRPVHALEIAARSGDESLAGYAYYTQLMEIGPGFDPGVVEDGKQYARSRITLATLGGAAAAPNEEPRIGTPAVLTHEQKARLLAGHWSLTRLWERLRTTAPPFERPEGCTYHQHGCLSTWAQVWREVGRSDMTLRREAADVLGRLGAMEDQLRMHADLANALSPQCKRAALLAVRAAVTEVKEGLAGHFCDLASDVCPAPPREGRGEE